MHPDKKLEQEVCARYCAYYKPGAGEDLACRGLAVLNGLIGKGLEFKALPDARASVSPETDSIIDRKVCSGCDWRAGDCDYRDPSASRGARPCGGVVYIALMIEAGYINEHDLEATRD